VVKVEMAKNDPSGAKQAAEKDLPGVDCRSELLQGLKPGIDLIGFSGPAEAVPLLQSGRNWGLREFFRSL
jgi:hypothetical protein